MAISIGNGGVRSYPALVGIWLARIPVCLALALAPLPWGSAGRTWVAAWCFCLALAIGFASLRHFRPVHLIILLPTLAVFLAFCGLVWLQFAPWAPLVTSNPIWHDATELLGVNLNPRSAVDAGSPLRDMGPPIAIFLSFLAGFLVSTERSGAWLIVRLVASAAALYALWALADLFYFDARRLFATEAVALEPLSLPFVNRNHAATFYGTGSILWLAIILAGLQDRIGRSGVSFAEMGPALLAEEPGKLLLSAGGFLLCVSATAMTLSRAGILLSFAMLALALGLFAFRWLKGQPKAPVIVAVALIAGAILLEIFAGRLGFRIGMEGLTDSGRRETYASTLAIIRDYPLFGTGLGTFAEVFPHYRSPLASTIGVWAQAHDTPLEIAAEMGLPFLGLVGFLWIYALLLMLRGAFKRGRDAVLPLAGFAVGLLATLHSFVDFPLQIPGYAIVWAGLAGMGLAQSFASERRPVRSLISAGEPTSGGHRKQTR